MLQAATILTVRNDHRALLINTDTSVLFRFERLPVDVSRTDALCIEYRERPHCRRIATHRYGYSPSIVNGVFREIDDGNYSAFVGCQLLPALFSSQYKESAKQNTHMKKNFLYSFAFPVLIKINSYGITT